MRHFVVGLVLSLGASFSFGAQSLANLSTADASGGLKQALIQGALTAVHTLGRPGGFQNNPEVHIELPGNIGKAAQLMKQLGMGAQVEQLDATMNRAAEVAVLQAEPLLVDAIKNMTVQDAKGILTGPDDSATQYLERSSRAQLHTRLLPIVKQATDQVGLARQYNAFAGQGAQFGLVDANSANLEGYVTEQTLNGLFKLVADKERAIRQDPGEQASGLVRRVFSALGR